MGTLTYVQMAKEISHKLLLIVAKWNFIKGCMCFLSDFDALLYFLRKIEGYPIYK
jgi:hypothetical protein